jgi:hypothetical protein
MRPYHGLGGGGVGPKGQPVDTNDYRLVSSSLSPGPVTRNPIPGVRVGCAGRIVNGTVYRKYLLFMELQIEESMRGDLRQLQLYDDLSVTLKTSQQSRTFLKIDTSI